MTGRLSQDGPLLLRSSPPHESLSSSLAIAELVSVLLVPCALTPLPASVLTVGSGVVVEHGTRRQSHRGGGAPRTPPVSAPSAPPALVANAGKGKWSANVSSAPLW